MMIATQSVMLQEQSFARWEENSNTTRSGCFNTLSTRLSARVSPSHAPSASRISPCCRGQSRVQKLLQLVTKCCFHRITHQGGVSVVVCSSSVRPASHILPPEPPRSLGVLTSKWNKWVVSSGTSERFGVGPTACEAYRAGGVEQRASASMSRRGFPLCTPVAALLPYRVRTAIVDL